MLKLLVLKSFLQIVFSHSRKVKFHLVVLVNSVQEGGDMGVLASYLELLVHFYPFLLLSFEFLHCAFLPGFLDFFVDWLQIRLQF